ncbi:MAG TPA: 2'-5' RNA ligase family protein [Bryobacteraceae bacterium]|nr:2'-5' RNA ligase family protein [Bryobacteraceae bacterium]
MDSDPDGAHSSVPPLGGLNILALVIYIPGPLGRFLDDLRRELVPYYNPHAHVSVLPPRPLAVDCHTVSERVRALLGAWAPFQVELTGLQVFPATDVLYLELGAGAEKLHRMHDTMTGDPLDFHEPFPYHPHVTLAQEVAHESMPALLELASARWNEYRGPRAFRAERAVLVQNTSDNLWIDLAAYSLGSAER